MGGFKPVFISLESWDFGFFGRCSNGFWIIPVIGVKWDELCGLGKRIVLCELC
jgi:hypothetical protein